MKQHKIFPKLVDTTILGRDIIVTTNSSFDTIVGKDILVKDIVII